MDLRGQHHAPVPIQQQAGWAPDAVWTVWRRETSVVPGGIKYFHCRLSFAYLFRVIPSESVDEILRKLSGTTVTPDSSVFFSLCTVSNMNSVVVRTSEVDMMITPLNIQLWNWRTLFLIRNSCVEVMLLRNINMHSNFYLKAAVWWSTGYRQLKMWVSLSNKHVCVCVCVLHNVSNFKLGGDGNLWYYMGEICS